MDWPQAVAVVAPALVTGFATYFVATRTSRSQRTQERVRAQRDLLQQRLTQLESLYGECLVMWFRWWNDDRSTDKILNDDSTRLACRLRVVSTTEIADAFEQAIAAIHSTVKHSKPIRIEDFADADEFERQKLLMLKPSAKAFDRLENLVRSHLSRVREQLISQEPDMAV